MCRPYNNEGSAFPRIYQVHCRTARMARGQKPTPQSPIPEARAQMRGTVRHLRSARTGHIQTKASEDVESSSGVPRLPAHPIQGNRSTWAELPQAPSGHRRRRGRIRSRGDPELPRRSDRTTIPSQVERLPDVSKLLGTSFSPHQCLRHSRGVRSQDPSRNNKRTQKTRSMTTSSDATSCSGTHYA